MAYYTLIIDETPVVKNFTLERMVLEARPIVADAHCDAAITIKTNNGKAYYGDDVWTGTKESFMSMSHVMEGIPAIIKEANKRGYSAEVRNGRFVLTGENLPNGEISVLLSYAHRTVYTIANAMNTNRAELEKPEPTILDRMTESMDSIALAHPKQNALIEIGGSKLDVSYPANTDLDTRFQAICNETGDTLSINGWLIESIDTY